MGNTCYVNAALQAISNCPPIADYFRYYEVLPDVKPITGVEPGIATSFQQLISAIWSKSRIGHVSPFRLLTVNHMKMIIIINEYIIDCTECLSTISWIITTGFTRIYSMFSRFTASRTATTRL